MKILKLLFICSVAFTVSGCETLGSRTTYHSTTRYYDYQPTSSYIVSERRYVNPYRQYRYRHYQYQSASPAISPYDTYQYEYYYVAPTDPFQHQYRSYWYRRY